MWFNLKTFYIYKLKASYFPTKQSHLLAYYKTKLNQLPKQSFLKCAKVLQKRKNVVSARGFHLNRLLHYVKQDQVQYLVSFVGCKLHCIAKLIMHIYVENVTIQFTKPIFWHLDMYGVFCATLVKILLEDVSMELHQRSFFNTTFLTIIAFTEIAQNRKVVLTFGFCSLQIAIIFFFQFVFSCLINKAYSTSSHGVSW